MLKRLPGALLCLFALLMALPAAFAQSSDTPRVTALYTTWDDYYFYIGAQVHDTKVNATNTTPTSQPQQDDDLEVFLETDNVRAQVRTPQTYQMAVSAANGAYFSVGNGSKIPAAKAVYTYKYAAGVDGTLNTNGDTDTGYTVEMAIPWQEMGLSGAPKPGTVWGFNVLSRDRDSTSAPALRFYSLSPDVKRAADVQDPSKWTRIVFEGGSSASTDGGRIVCPHVSLDRFPIINGSIVAGEWPSTSRTEFGTDAVTAPAPTVAEEPNTDASPFDNPPPAPDVTAQTPAPAPDVPPAPEVLAPGTAIGAISLPGGGSIKIVPGGIKPPPYVPPTPQVASVPQDSGTGISGVRVNPLTPKYPKNYRPAANSVDLTGSLQLTEARPTRLVMAIYRMDYNADGRKGVSQNVRAANGATLLADQPLNGAGPWFSGLRPQWHRQQLSDLRRAGIDVALLRCQADDPLLGRELDALVEALKELKAANQDYPLIGLEQRAGVGSASADTVFAQIPAEFRAQAVPDGGTKAGVVVATAPGGTLAFGALADAAPVTQITEDTVVSPGRVDTAVIPRNGGETYAAGWAAAIATKAQYVIIDSWNDFSHGTEVCASRQYSEKYADDTRLLVNAFNGDKQWHAKYLAEQCPRVIRPRTLYQIPIRITNAGTLPWRAGEGYSLCPRWYKDGRLYDDSAPRIPVGTDVLPGQTITLSVGLAAQNQYGDDLDPGNYVLVFDIVQGQDRWFSYASDSPLQIPVKIIPFAQEVPAQATFIGTTTPTVLQNGAPYSTAITVRNDGSAHWNNDLLAYKVQTVDPDTGDVRTVSESAGETLPTPILPGEAVTVNVTVLPKASNGAYRLHWFVKPGKDGADTIPGAYDEAVQIVPADPGASFVLSDVPRTADAGKDVTARLAVQNLGPDTWRKGSRKVGYHWYYLDGTEAQWDTNSLAPLTKDVAVGRADGDISLKFHTPDQPGRYALLFDVQQPDGTWASTLPGGRGNDTLQVFVTVGGKGSVVPVDLKKYADAVGISSDPLTTNTGGFDGKGRTFPADTIPPDATTEVDGNPLLIGQPGAPLYPSGYYAGGTSNHRVSFLYPAPDTNNVVTCHGQTIDLPADEYRFVHILAAAAGGGTTVVGAFTLGANPAQSITVADWNADTGGTNPVAFRSPYRLGASGPDVTPAVLRDYALPVTGRISTITLPDNPAIKIVAISLEK